MDGAHAPFYTSVDIRNAGFKLAPVDTNLFPGGWNNLTKEMLPWRCRRPWRPSKRSAPKARNLLIIPENHTRNTFYLANVVQLQRIFNMAGLNVRVGSISPGDQETHAHRVAQRRFGDAGACGAYQGPPGAQEL